VYSTYYRLSQTFTKGVHMQCSKDQTLRLEGPRQSGVLGGAPSPSSPIREYGEYC